MSATYISRSQLYVHRGKNGHKESSHIADRRTTKHSILEACRHPAKKRRFPRKAKNGLITNELALSQRFALGLAAVS